MRTNSTAQFGLAVTLMFAGVGALLGLCATDAITEDATPRPVVVTSTGPASAIDIALP